MSDEHFIKKVIRLSTRICPECKKNVKAQISKDPNSASIHLNYYHSHKDFYLTKELSEASIKKLIKDYEKKQRAKNK